MSIKSIFDSASYEAESRCGKKCSECSYREEYGCAGCKEITDGYWGSKCELKECCEGKCLDNCAECKSFPCELLREFSFDKETGDDGQRLLNCKEWADSKQIKKEQMLKNLLLGLSLGAISGAIAGAICGITATLAIGGALAGFGIAVMIEISKRN